MPAQTIVKCFFLCTVALLGRCGPAVYAADEPFKVLPVHLTFTEDEFAALQPRKARPAGLFAAPKPAGTSKDGDRDIRRNNFGVDLPWAKASVTVDGDTFSDVGIRYKGNGTLFDAARTAKKSFQVDLDRYGGKARFRKSKTINLHCGVADPSKYREAFGYALYRAAGVAAPRTSFAEVRITVPGKYDNELLGLYIVVEEIDKPFLRDRFGSDKGLLMKPEGVREIEDRGADWSKYKAQYRPQWEATPDEARRMTSFAKLVHKADDATFRQEIASYLDIDQYLRFLATTTFIANVDSFFALGHNYYLYLHPKTGQLHVMPWDLDRAFANLPFFGPNEQKMDLSITRPYAGAHRLTDRVMAMPGMTEKYQALFKEMSATCFAKDRLLADIAAAETAMKDVLARDAKAAASRSEGFQTASIFTVRPPDLRTFVEKRAASVAAQLAGKSKGFVMAGGFGQGQQPKAGDMLAGPLLEALDANRDGKMSRDEWESAARRVFAACEKDADGRIDQKSLGAGLNGMFPKAPDWMPAPPVAFSLGNMMAGPIVTRADANKDGKLTVDELVAAANVLFDQIDEKKAGVLDHPAFSEMITRLFPIPGGAPPAGNPAQPKAGEPKASPPKTGEAKKEP